MSQYEAFFFEGGKEKGVGWKSFCRRPVENSFLVERYSQTTRASVRVALQMECVVKREEEAEKLT